MASTLLCEVRRITPTGRPYAVVSINAPSGTRAEKPMNTGERGRSGERSMPQTLSKTPGLEYRSGY